MAYMECKKKEYNTSVLVKDIDLKQIYFNEIKQLPIISASEERNLLLEYKKTNDHSIKKKLVESHLRFVVQRAKKYCWDYVSFLDIVQEGNIALLKSIDTFDVTKGVRLLTYAGYKIQLAMLRYVNKYSKCCFLSVGKSEGLTQYRREKNLLTAKLNRVPSFLELEQYLGYSKQEILENEQLLQNDMSLSYPILDENLDDVLKDEGGIEKEVFSNYQKKQLYDALNQLSEREKYILILRYGLLDGQPMTRGKCSCMLFELGFSETIVSATRIDQLEKHAMAVVRRYFEEEKLKEDMTREERILWNFRKNRISISFFDYARMTYHLTFEEIQKELSKLLPIVKHIIMLRYGLYDGKARSYSRVGDDLVLFGYTIKRITTRAIMNYENLGFGILENANLIEALHGYFQIQDENQMILEAESRDQQIVLKKERI